MISTFIIMVFCITSAAIAQCHCQSTGQMPKGVMIAKAT